MGVNDKSLGSRPHVIEWITSNQRQFGAGADGENRDRLRHDNLGGVDHVVVLAGGGGGANLHSGRDSAQRLEKRVSVPGEANSAQAAQLGCPRDMAQTKKQAFCRIVL